MGNIAQQGLVSAAFNFSKQIITANNPEQIAELLSNPKFFEPLEKKLLAEACSKFDVQILMEMWGMNPPDRGYNLFKYPSDKSKIKDTAYRKAFLEITAEKLVDLARLVGSKSGIQSTSFYDPEILKRNKDAYLLAVTILITNSEKFNSLQRDFKRNGGIWPTFKSSYPDSIINYLPEPKTREWQHVFELGKNRFDKDLRRVIRQSFRAVKKFDKAQSLKKPKTTHLSPDEESPLESEGLWMDGLERPNIPRVYTEPTEHTNPLEISGQKNDQDTQNVEVTEGSPNPAYKDTLDSSVINTQNDAWNRLIDTHGATKPIDVQQDKRKIQEVVVRPNQAQFRERILQLYDFRCCMTETGETHVLEAAHVKDWSVSNNDDVRNGLCLRSDIHKLFDKGLLLIGTDYKIHVSQSITDKEYRSLHGKKIKLPQAQLDWPKKEFIEWRLEKFDGVS